MRGNFVGVVSDSTRVLGDGDVTPAGGLGVMEGKALLMKYLGGIDAVPICIDSKTCDIPVCYDDQQCIAPVTLAGLLNALRLVHKRLEDIKMVFIGAGSANATCLRLIVSTCADPKKIVIFDINGSLHSGREDIEKDSRFNGNGSIVTKPIVLYCGNPVLEIYPYEAKEAGAYIFATGRGDFPNQFNNSVGLPGILKGTLIVKAKKITDNMTITASKALADFAEKRGIIPDNIIGTMDEPGISTKRSRGRYASYQRRKKDIKEAREGADLLIEKKFIKEFPQGLLDESINTAINVATK
ncbi:malic enzyme, putative [Entamoeba invadens IP1]|uniref:Malic enzyme, putative n=1 Tax=Entamoeba invadens IP1 TaxID=370355 RepID=L7FJ67_ENTIV|nr:malic enzyme, putative [Entamoeba invadens IP1]ELP83933.1 malic enzyme, putative [Entamoeba invadens IP1]|eukprot:XP_004183279.1 malic enzyme, putative [Entamoeba invadens IP1]